MENMIGVELITGIIASIISGAALTALVWYIKKQNKTNKDAKDRQIATEKGVKALLRDRIIQLYNFYSDKGCMPIYARENAESLFTEYMALGGNGVVKGLIDKLMHLPVDNPTDPDKEDRSVVNN